MRVFRFLATVVVAFPINYLFWEFLEENGVPFHLRLSVAIVFAVCLFYLTLTPSEDEVLWKYARALNEKVNAIYSNLKRY